MVGSSNRSLVIKRNKYTFIPEGLEETFERFASVFALELCFSKDRSTGETIRNIDFDHVANEFQLFAFSIAYLYPDEMTGLLSTTDRDPIVYALNIFHDKEMDFRENEVHALNVIEDDFEEMAYDFVRDSGGGEETTLLNYYGFLEDLYTYLKQLRIVHFITVNGYMEDIDSYLFPQKEVW